MIVADILRKKGRAVMTIRPNETICSVARRFRQEGVGALVVTADGEALDGLITERDVSNGLARFGGDVHSLLASALMTANVVTCSPRDRIVDIARTMTERHLRHLPVTENRCVIGLVSIGDVLKLRLDEVQLEAHVLRDIALASR